MEDLISFFGRVSGDAKWKHGKVRVVSAFDYEKECKTEYKYLKGKYPDMIDLYEVNDVLKGKKRMTRSSNFYDLSNMNNNDKLIIVGHSDEDGYQDFSSEQLAHMLVSMRLKNIGVIKLHSCYIGKGKWMEAFKQALKRNAINFAYMSGSRGLYWYIPARGALNYKIISGNIRKDFKSTRYIFDNIDTY